MSEVTYPYDETGTASTNLVTGELHTLTEVNSAPYRILIPTFAPFYLHNLALWHVSILGERTLLREGVEYHAALPYMAAQRSLGKPIYGGLAFITELAQGTIETQYQTVGGPWCADAQSVYNTLLTTAYNNRLVWWDQITNVQQLFPPTEHRNDATDIAGHETLLAKIEGIIQAILTRQDNAPASYVAHLLAKGNIHDLTPTDLGLGQVQNLPMATDQEVMEKQPVEKYITLRQLLMLLPPQ
jgi:hypothetical protein